MTNDLRHRGRPSYGTGFDRVSGLVAPGAALRWYAARMWPGAPLSGASRRR